MAFLLQQLGLFYFTTKGVILQPIDSCSPVNSATTGGQITTLFPSDSYTLFCSEDNRRSISATTALNTSVAPKNQG